LVVCLRDKNSWTRNKFVMRAPWLKEVKVKGDCGSIFNYRLGRFVTKHKVIDDDEGSDLDLKCGTKFRPVLLLEFFDGFGHKS